MAAMSRTLPGTVRREQKPIAQERMRGARSRLRDVRKGPDGLLYVLTETEGAMLRIEPVP
jgi:glucose/arabinose dehydrogenase